MAGISHRESRDLDVPVERMFDLVADVERYPEFLPLMREARIVGHFDGGYETEQTLALGPLTHRFRTRTQLDRPRSIVVTSDDGIFCLFDIRWLLTRTAARRCCVDLVLNCEFRSMLLQSLGDLLVGQMALTMVNAFSMRAREQSDDQDRLSR